VLAVADKDAQERGALIAIEACLDAMSAENIGIMKAAIRHQVQILRDAAGSGIASAGHKMVCIGRANGAPNAWLDATNEQLWQVDPQTDELLLRQHGFDPANPACDKCGARMSKAAGAGNRKKFWDREHGEQEMPEQAGAGLREKANQAYCDYIDQMKRPECLGYEQKLKEGKFGRPELDAHVRAGELLGRHRAFAEVYAEQEKGK
jgi:hypothetical protein